MIIETMFSNHHYIELFARNQRKGWTSWGMRLRGGPLEDRPNSPGLLDTIFLDPTIIGEDKNKLLLLKEQVC